MIKFKQDKENIVDDVLSRRYVVLSTLNVRLFGFEHVKDSYVTNVDFGQVYKTCENSAFDDFYRFYGYLFK